MKTPETELYDLKTASSDENALGIIASRLGVEKLKELSRPRPPVRMLKLLPTSFPGRVWPCGPMVPTLSPTNSLIR